MPRDVFEAELSKRFTIRLIRGRKVVFGLRLDPAKALNS